MKAGKSTMRDFVRRFWLPALIVFWYSYIVVLPTDRIDGLVMSPGDHIVLILKAIVFGGASFVLFALVFALIESNKK